MKMKKKEEKEFHYIVINIKSYTKELRKAINAIDTVKPINREAIKILEDIITALQERKPCLDDRQSIG